MEEIVKTEQKRRVVLTNFGGQAFFAKEIPDELPPIETLQYVDEKGNFSREPSKAQEELSFYWRNKAKPIAIILLVSSLGFMLFMLAATGKYTDAIWSAISGTGNTIIGYLVGLLPPLPKF